MASKATVTLKKERETKNTVRFTEDHENPVLGTIYVPKTTLAVIGNPTTIIVDISAGKDE